MVFTFLVVLYKAIGEPAIDDVAHRDIAGLLVVLIDTVQPYAVRPFPACPSPLVSITRPSSRRSRN